MKQVKRWLTLTVCALLFIGNVSAAISSEDDDEVNVVRPSGVNKRHAKSTSRTRSRSSADSGKTDDISIPASALTPGPSGAVPNTRANSVVVVDARTGAVLHEKNADQPRPAASTQKLLTALIIAETGYLDRPVRVEPIDTFAEPVRLNIRPGEVYQRIDLLRALLVKSPNDVARCLARDNAGSIEAFADRMNAKAQLLGAIHSHFLNPNGLPIPGQ
jgi:D-alanyl-D-alanine carboxypeptidase (penicillin-binding protein 5/6)